MPSYRLIHEDKPQLFETAIAAVSYALEVSMVSFQMEHDKLAGINIECNLIEGKVELTRAYKNVREFYTGLHEHEAIIDEIKQAIAVAAKRELLKHLEKLLQVPVNVKVSYLPTSNSVAQQVEALAAREVELQLQAIVKECEPRTISRLFSSTNSMATPEKAAVHKVLSKGKHRMVVSLKIKEEVVRQIEVAINDMQKRNDSSMPPAPPMSSSF